MRHFSYQNGVLHAENVPLSLIAEQVGTPTYIYSRATLTHHVGVLRAAFGNLPVRIAYAVKANANRAVLACLARLGVGADTVSEGEIRRAINAGIAADAVTFAGVGKTDAELAFAVDMAIHQVNVESAQELERLNAIAVAKGRKQAVVIRVNPDVAAATHAKITTGTLENKFGVSLEQAIALYEQAQTMAGIDMVGLSAHIGSQIADLAPLKQTYILLGEAVKTLRAKGFSVTRLDLGGGLAATYDEDGRKGADIGAYGAMVKDVLGDLDVALEVEPGRLIAANAGLLLTRAVVTKTNGKRDFLVLDAAMNDLLRPTLYDAFHEILPVAENGQQQVYDIVGPICETGDTFARERAMGATNPGDLVAIMSAGAYSFAMASSYNSRPLAAEVMVDGDQWAITRPRQTWEEMYGSEAVPSFL